MNPKTRMLISAGLVVVGFAMIKWEDRVNRKRAEQNSEAIKQRVKESEDFAKTVENINADLDRRIEAGKFWLIVTDDEN